MKPFQTNSGSLDATAQLFIVLLIATGSALLLGGQFGLLRIDQMEKFWPVTLVAAGLVHLLSYNERKQS